MCLCVYLNLLIEHNAFEVILTLVLLVSDPRCYGKNSTSNFTLKCASPLVAINHAFFPVNSLVNATQFSVNVPTLSVFIPLSTV